MFNPNRPSSAASSSNPYSPSSTPPPSELPITRSRTLYYLSIRDSSVSSPSRSRSRKYKERSRYDDDVGGDGEEGEGLMGRAGRDVKVDMGMGAGLPPKWVDTTEEVDDILSRARLKLVSLEKLHAKHVLPGFTDRSAEEREIEVQTVDITRDLRAAQSLISSIRPAPSSTPNEITAARNVQRALAGKVQDLSGGFRKKQKVYMQKLQGLAVKNKDLLAASGAITLRGAERFDDLEDDERDSHNTQSQLQSQTQSNHNLSHITKRDQEITQIAKSITELADLFRDLGNLVVEQGTLLDCVEYNVMETGKELEGAVKELEVAQSYQRNTGKRKCILLLILIIFGLFIILIYKPRSHSLPAPITSSPGSDSGSSTTTTTAHPANSPVRPPRPHPIKSRPPRPAKTRPARLNDVGRSEGRGY